MFKMKTDNSHLEHEAFSILSASTGKKRDIVMSCVIHTTSGDFFIERLDSIDIHSDYVSKFSDNMILSGIMPLGDYVKYVLPDNETLTVTITILLYSGTLILNLKAIPDTSGNPEQLTLSGASLESLNTTMTKFRLNCVNQTVSDLRVKTVSGNSQSTVYDVIVSHHGLTGGIIGQVGAMFGVGLKMSPPNNTRVYDNLIIPTGVKLIGLAAYIQNKYGVYNGGINTFLSTYPGMQTYIYPVFNKARFGSLDRSLRIIGIDNQLLTVSDSSYVVTNKMLTIITSTPVVTHADRLNLKNGGNKIAITEAHSVMGRPAQITPDTVIIKSEAIHRRSQHSDAKGIEAPVASGTITNNHYRERTKVLANDGYYIQVQWGYSNSSYITPMMNTVICYEKDGVPIEVEGVVHQRNSLIDQKGGMETTLLTIFVFNRRTTNTPILKRLI